MDIKNIKNSISKNLDLPSEIILNIPLITTFGRNKLIIENFKSIIHYSNTSIKIKTSCGIFKIDGKNLLLEEITKSQILLKGCLDKFEFI